MARFMQMGTTKIYWLTTIASLATALTATETNAGINVTGQLSDLSGFSFDNTPIDTPDMSTALVTKIPGEDAVADSSLTFYEDKTTNPIKAALTKGTSGYVVILGYGTAGASPAAGDKADIWPVIVSSNARQYAAGAAASKYLVKMAPTLAPVIERSIT